MDSVKEFLFNEIEDRDDITDQDLELHLKVGSKQIRNLRSGKRELTFRNLLVLTQLVDEENYKEHILNWYDHLDTDDCIRNIFEYAAITRNIDLLDRHLEKYKTEKKHTVEKYVKVYTFIRDYLKGNVNFSLIDQELDKFKSLNNPKLSILVEIYQCISLLQKREFSYVLAKATDLEKQIKAMSAKTQLFEKECYLYRISEVLAFTHLFMNNLKEAEHYSFILLNANINKRVDSDALYILGMTKLLTDEKKCLDLLKRSIEAAKETGVSRLEGYALYNFNFAKVLLSKPLDGDAPKPLRALQQFLNKEISQEKARDIISEMNDPDLTAYFESCCGIKNKYKKFCDFVSASNLFFAVIIVRDLIAVGENSDFVKTLTSNLKTVEKGEVIFEEDFICCFNVCGSSSRSICA
ncbi:AimR family lysis-lysogeny pheromone receptor [Bacillus mojavensis]|uniref:AimR family lysis-lysogeny pheromone receptor n=1 Tax=Bacillus mojavensis TaxID=72360 RepID=UPI002DBDFD08|nr:AimR family lysis-lysogeny pheromone receptor [Bacillus mojavensis]MEC1625483.1 AimR family lysis-lysogeny pheromone receptor [Bacillus mojavensis]